VRLWSYLTVRAQTAHSINPANKTEYFYIVFLLLRQSSLFAFNFCSEEESAV
jgi:hypothetical protein